MVGSTERARGSLKARVLGSCLASITVVLATMGAVQYATERTKLDAALRASIERAAQRLASDLAAPLWNVTPKDAENVLVGEMVIDDISSIAVVDAEGHLFSAVARKDGGAVVVSQASPVPEAALTRELAVAHDGTDIGKAVIVYGRDLLVERLRAELVRTLVQLAVVDAVLAIVLLLIVKQFVATPLSRLTEEAAGLAASVRAGQLDRRGDARRLAPEFQPALLGMNDTMDAFARPLAMATENLSRISNGDIPPKITEEYEGDFNQIKDALNRCIGSLAGLIGEMNRMSAEHEKGDIDVVVDTALFKGVYRTMAQGVNDMVGAHIAVNRKAMGVFAEFGKGSFDATMEQLPGKKRFVNEAIEEVRRNLRDLISELNRVSRQHEAGEVDVVIDLNRFQGEYRAMADGINKAVGGHIAVNRKAMACVSAFGSGNFEARLETFPGKQAFINETIELVRTRLKALIADANGLVQAAVAGQLSTRADATKHEGDFRKIVDGVNRTLDAVVAPIQEAAQVLERLAQRDLGARITGTYQGDHAQITNSVNGTAAALHEALTQVASAVDQVSSAATQIASSSQAVASGASEQASSVEETTASVQSVTEQTRQSAEHANQASLLAQNARSAASDGAAAVEQLQGAMGKIKRSAEGTSQIIKDVSDIAFQTNLLALNAAVEAARAGEAGRGFAVVAEEVRSLALRAKEAATKTEDLIRQSLKQADEGEVAAKNVAGKLSEIVQGVSKVTDIVSGIAASATEQTVGIMQVSQAISEMDKVTQQNAASAEESSSAAGELSGQAEELAAMVGTFHLESRSDTWTLDRAATPQPTSPRSRRNGQDARVSSALPVAGAPSRTLREGR